MIASLLIAAAAVLPPEGPLVWKGAPVELVERVKYYRIVPMQEPELVPSPRARYEGRDLDRLVEQFAESQTADDAFTVFNRLVTDLGTNAYATVSSSCDYLVRFAAAKGHKKAREFFDDEGRPLTGLAFEYVLAKYRQYYSGRDELPRPEWERGFGDSPATAIRPYACDGELQALLDRYAMTAKWYEDRLPFLEFTPKDCPADEVPLVVYIPGSGEQGADIAVQFKQRACLEKVVSAEFQKRHPCRFMVICLPAEANCNIGDGYPNRRDKRSDLYYDMILASAKHADGPKVDPRRIYLTGLGSGASIACGLALDHPGRFAAVAPVWGHPRTTLVHPRAPGNWRFYNTFDPEHPKPSHDTKLMQFYAQRFKGFTENVRSAGGDCSFLVMPEVETGWWWDAVWSGDEIYDWMFGKTASVAPHVGEASPPPQEYGCLLNEHVHSEIQKPVEIRGANPRLIDIAAFGYHKLEVNVYNDSRDLVKVSNSILSLMLRTQQNRPSTLIGNDIECCYSADDSQFTVVPPGGYTQVSGLVSKQIAEMIRDAGASEVVIRIVLPDEKRQSLRIKINLDKNA